MNFVCRPTYSPSFSYCARKTCSSSGLSGDSTSAASNGNERLSAQKSLSHSHGNDGGMAARYGAQEEQKIVRAMKTAISNPGKTQCRCRALVNTGCLVNPSCRRTFTVTYAMWLRHGPGAPSATSFAVAMHATSARTMQTRPSTPQTPHYYHRHIHTHNRTYIP